MRLKALLVDDELNILRNLSAVLPWEALRIDIAGLARNGVEALQQVRQHRPDIVLCDIRMPLMDGIEFLEQLEAEPGKPEVIMLTGYQDFEYARSVIRFGVRDYILKPFDYEQLAAAVGKLAGTIRAARKERHSEERRWDQARRLLHEKLLHDIIMDYASESSCEELLQDSALPTGAMHYCVLLADCDDYLQKTRAIGEQERKAYNQAIRAVFQATLDALELRCVVLQLREGEWCALVERPDPTASDAETCVVESEEATLWAELLQRRVSELQHANLSLGIHSSAALNELPQVYRALQRLVHLTADKDRSIMLHKADSLGEYNQDSIWDTIEALMSALKQMNRPSVEHLLRTLKRQLFSISGRSLADVERIGSFVVLHMMREMKEIGVISADKELELWALIERAQRIKDQLAIVKRLVQECQESTAGKKNGDVLMQAAKDYIQRHLTRDLGIEEVAEQLGISSSYFSLLFKQQFGFTFVEYITSERVAMAQSMLLLTDKSVTEIARLVGYAERRYFTKVFQKVTGEIPSQFREKRREDGG